MGYSWEHIEYSWLLLVLIPVFFTWYLWEWGKKKILQKMVSHPRLATSLFKQYDPQKSKTRVVIFSIAIAGIIIALMNPRVEVEKYSTPSEGVQVMFVVDVSNSMLANDIAPNRLEKARSFAIKVAERFGGSRIGLIAFAGEARLQMPPTTDLGAVRQALQTLGPSSVATQGTNIEAALTEANLSLSANALKKKCVILISDGETLEGDAMATAKKLSQSGMMIYVVGVGSNQGASLSDPETRLPITDGNDQQVISRLNEKQLKRLAEISGGKYLLLQDTESSVKTMIGYLKDMEKIPLENGDLVNYYSFSPWILFLVLLLLTGEWWLYLVRTVFFGRGKKAILPVMCFFLWMVEGLTQKGKKDFAAGMTAYQAGNFNEALTLFDMALEKDPNVPEAKFFRALSDYKLKNYPKAGSGFKELASSVSNKEIASASYNNAGLAFANQNNVEQAVDMFKQALKINPTDTEIRKNLQKAISDLKKQQPPPTENKEQAPPMDKEDANQKLQDISDQEREAREKMKPRKTGASTSKNW